MFNNKVSRKELFTSNPGHILQQQFSRKDFNDSAFLSSENQSDPSSQMDNSQSSYEMYSQRFSQSCSQPSESSSSQKFYRKYMSKAPLFQRDPTCSIEKRSSKNPPDYLDHLEVNKQRAKEKDNRDLLNTFVSLVKDCSDEVKTAVQIIKDSVNKSLSDSADQSAILIDKINEGLSLHYQRLLEAIHTDHKQQLTTSEFKEIIATRDAKIELLESQLEAAQKEKDEKVMEFLKEAYNEQKQLTKTQLDQLQKNQQIINDKHIKTLQEQQEMFNKEKRNVELNTECKHCDGQGMSKDLDPVQKVPPTIPMNEVLRGAYQPNQAIYSTQYNLQQPQAMCTTLPTTIYHKNPVSQTCWSVQPTHTQPSNHTLPNSINHLHGLHMTNNQQSSMFYHPREYSKATVLPRPLSSSTPTLEIVSPIVSASFGRRSADSFIKKPSPIATVVPLMKSRIEDHTAGKDYEVDKDVELDRNYLINFNNGQARKCNSARLNVAPTRQSARLQASKEDHIPRPRKDYYSSNDNPPTNAMETNQQLQITRRNKNKFNTKDSRSNKLISKRKTGPKSLQAECLYSDDNKMSTAKPWSRKRIHQEINNAPNGGKAINCEEKDYFIDRKNLKKDKAKPKRKSLKEKCLPRSSSYSDLNTASRAPTSSDKWKWKRHSSFTIGVDSSSDDENIFSFVDENSPPVKLCKLAQGEKLISSRIINQYPDTEQSSQESGVFPLASPLQRENCKEDQLPRNCRKQKMFERTEHDSNKSDEDDEDEDDVFSVGSINDQRKYISRQDKNKKESDYNQTNSRRQLFSICKLSSDTNILEISKYIRQQQSRRQER